MDSIKVVDFKGVPFYDIGPCLRDNFSELIDELVEKIGDLSYDYIVGLESRGFIVGAAVAARMSKGFIPIRKPGKLPPPVVSKEFMKEYGPDTFEMALQDLTGKRIIMVDDILATGGSMMAAIELVEGQGGNILSTLFMMEIGLLTGRERVLKKVSVKVLKTVY
jgi:adenine phosphoribosyltransferase